MPTVPPEAWPFCYDTYPALSPVISSERCINYYPEVNHLGSKSKLSLIATPGIQPFGGLPKTPVRALWAGNGRLFAVGGTNLYEVNPATGVPLTDYGPMAGSTGVGPCQIVVSPPAANGSNQLLVMDPSVPNGTGVNGRVFSADPIGLVMNAVVDGYYLKYIDTFFVVLCPVLVGGVTVIQVRNSASADGNTWPALNYFVRSETADFVNGLAIVNDNLWVFGQQNTEPFYNAGTAGTPFAKIQGGLMNYGAMGWPVLGAYHIVEIGNTVYWLGADSRGSAVVYRADGFVPIRVSNSGVEHLIATYGNLQDARAFAYQEDGHLFYWLNFPNANGGLGATLVYDLTTGLWHERAYRNPGTANLERHRADCFASVQIGTQITNFVGDYQTGTIYKMALSIPDDMGSLVYRERTAPHVSNLDRWVKHKCLTLDGDFGSATPILTYSDDGGKTFPHGPRIIPLIGTAAASGHDTYRIWQLGRSRDRVYRVTVLDNANLIRISNAYLDIASGTET